MKRGQFSRRRPYPYDAYIGGVPVMLMNDSGDFVERKTKPLDATSPSTYEYSSADPRVEKTFMWTELYLGLGENIAPTRERPRRYRRCQIGRASCRERV